MRDKPILCLDFDGVIHSYTSGWQGTGVCNDPPVEGTHEFLRKAINVFQVMIYSSRSKSFKGRRAMKRYMREHFSQYADEEFAKLYFSEPEFDDIPVGPPETVADRIKYPWFKPPAFLTIDDRAITFEGDWESAVYDPKALLNFKPWNKKVIINKKGIVNV